MSEKQFDWDAVVDQIYNEIGTNTALIDKYGLVLASKIKGFEKERLISPLIWELIENRTKMQKELDLQWVQSFILDTDQGFMVFVFGKNIYLMSIIPTTVNISEVIPTWKRILQIFDKSTTKHIDLNFLKVELQEEFAKLRRKDSERKDAFPVFPSLIKHLAKKKSSA